MKNSKVIYFGGAIKVILEIFILNHVFYALSLQFLNFIAGILLFFCGSPSEIQYTGIQTRQLNSQAVEVEGHNTPYGRGESNKSRF